MKEPIDRQKLYEEVWSDPVTIVAERYGLSDVGLAKICKKLSIPLPSRGYWAKLKAGKIMGRVALPAQVDTQSPSATIEKISETERESRAAAKRKAAEVRASIDSSAIENVHSIFHPLVKEAAKRLQRRDGWSNEKGLRSAAEEVLNIEVTPSSLDRALRLMDILIKDLARQAITIRIDARAKETVLDVEGTSVLLKLSEHVRRTPHEETPAETKERDRYWSSLRAGRSSSLSFPSITRFDFHPTGVLTITAGHWPSRKWNDTERTPLEKRLGEIVAGIILLADEMKKKEKKDADEREERHRAKERYEFIKQRRDNERALFDQLERNAELWERSKRLYEYIAEVQKEADAAGSLNPELQDWIIWARAKADWLNPQIQVSDLILEAPEPKKPWYY